MFGVMSEILDNEGASMRGEEDFFSVARTMPFVAEGQSVRQVQKVTPVDDRIYLLCLRM